MMISKYGRYSSAQLHSAKVSIRKSIFFLLLYVDPQEKEKYKDIDVIEAFHSIQYRLDGLNSILLLQSPEIIETMSLLEAALIEYNSECFEWAKYRKLILDAGAKIMQVKEGDDDGVNL